MAPKSLNGGKSSSVEELTTQSEVPAERDAVSTVCIGCKPKIKLISNNHLKLPHLLPSSSQTACLFERKDTISSLHQETE